MSAKLDGISVLNAPLNTCGLTSVALPLGLGTSASLPRVAVGPTGGGRKDRRTRKPPNVERWRSGAAPRRVSSPHGYRPPSRAPNAVVVTSLACPTAVGGVAITNITMTPLPAIAPGGTYDVQIVAVDTASAPVYCIDVAFKL